MFRSMFDRLLALFMIVIFLMAFIGAGLFMLSIRDALVNSRMDSLLVQARDIAFLAASLNESTLSSILNLDTPTMSYLQWKAKSVYEDYGAYILILDRSGRVMDNMQTALQSGTSDFLQTLDTEDIANLMMEVMKGKEIQTRIINESNGAVMTVAVPYLLNGEVYGAVLVHTSAQTVEAPYHGLALQLTIGFALAALVSMIGTALYARGIVKPLTVITRAAESMSQGNLAARANVTGVEEVCQLAGAFNVMAEKLEKVEAGRKEFVSNVSHELRSPVTSIHGYVEGMMDGTIPKEEYERYLQIVFDETNRLKRLIADLLQLSRMDNGVEKLQWSDFNINEQIRRILIGRMPDIEEKTLNVQMDFAVDPCMVHADIDRIAQVLLNIVDNALKFVVQNGSLTIRTSLLHDTIVEVEIENDGEPIAPEDRPHIFDRFYMAEKAHTSGKGTGLGLSICKQIIELHGQTIALTSKEDGAGFRFTLQAAQPPEMPKLSA